MQGESAVLVLPGVISLGIAVPGIPTIEINGLKPLDITAPLVRSKIFLIAPQGVGKVRIGCRDNQLSFFANLCRAPGRNPAFVSRCFGDTDLRLYPGKSPGFSIGLKVFVAACRA